MLDVAVADPMISGDTMIPTDGHTVRSANCSEPMIAKKLVPTGNEAASEQDFSNMPVDDSFLKAAQDMMLCNKKDIPKKR